ncbi:hypothetical protein J6590_067829 [Homalodisca vitripennis]|nr:hypothetical protein J6590_067829 [Homalodisca vitripennis]
MEDCTKLSSRHSSPGWVVEGIGVTDQLAPPTTDRWLLLDSLRTNNGTQFRPRDVTVQRQEAFGLAGLYCILIEKARELPGKGPKQESTNERLAVGTGMTSLNPLTPLPSNAPLITDELSQIKLRQEKLENSIQSSNSKILSNLADLKSRQDHLENLLENAVAEMPATPAAESIVLQTTSITVAKTPVTAMAEKITSTTLAGTPMTATAAETVTTAAEKSNSSVHTSALRSHLESTTLDTEKNKYHERKQTTTEPSIKYKTKNYRRNSQSHRSVSLQVKKSTEASSSAEYRTVNNVEPVRNTASRKNPPKTAMIRDPKESVEAFFNNNIHHFTELRKNYQMKEALFLGLNTQPWTNKKRKSTSKFELLLLHQNTQYVSNKIDRLQHLIEKEHPHIVILTEHGLRKEEIENTKILSGYNLKAHFSRSEHKSGGVAVYIENFLEDVTEEVNVSNYCREQVLEAALIQVKNGKDKLNILGTYRSP